VESPGRSTPASLKSSPPPTNPLNRRMSTIHPR
jgi:hypothetical protein